MIDLIKLFQLDVYEHRRAYRFATCSHIGNGNRVHEVLAGFGPRSGAVFGKGMHSIPQGRRAFRIEIERRLSPPMSRALKSVGGGPQRDQSAPRRSPPKPFVTS